MNTLYTYHISSCYNKQFSQRDLIEKHYCMTFLYCFSYSFCNEINTFKNKSWKHECISNTTCDILDPEKKSSCWMHFRHLKIGHFRVILDIQILPREFKDFFKESLSKNIRITDEKYLAWQRLYIVKQFKSLPEISFP